MARVTVLMAVYNALPHLRESVQSILDQTYEDFSFLIIDDHSTDGSWDVVKEFASRDRRIEVIRNSENRGLGYCLNLGVRNARSDLIARMDADDIAHPLRLEKQINEMDRNPDIDILGTQAIDIDDEGRQIRVRTVPLSPDQIRKSLPFANPIIHPSVVFRRKAILSVGCYDPSYRKLQDYELWFRCMANSLRFANLEDKLLYYRTGSNYYSRRSWEYRIIDARVRMRGCRLLRCSLRERLGILVPFALGITPRWALPGLYKIAEKLDPRQRNNFV